MTVREAIEGFKVDNSLLAENEGGTIERNNMAIDALEKQLSKKPLLRPKEGRSKIEEGDFRYVDCPNCKQKIFSGFHFLPWNEAHREHVYCIKCGQKIDWEDLSELVVEEN